MNLRRANLFFILIVLVLAFGLYFFQGFIERAAAPFLFKKTASLRSLFSFPFFRGTPDLGEIKTNTKLGPNFPENFLETVVLFRPPAIEYDQLIISKGAEEGIKEGMIALVSKEVAFGTVEEVFADFSRVKSFSSFGREIEIFLIEAGVSLTAVGKSNGELEISLPRDFTVQIGDEARTLTQPAYLLGLVERIRSSPHSPVKILIVKQPFNIYGLYSVGIQIQ